jgi:hypothetical protein
MSKAVKVLAWAVLVLVVLPIAAVLAINAFDEPLTPQAQVYGEPRSPAVPGDENGYYALVGLGAPDGADPIMYARAWMDEARAAARANRREKRQPEKRAKRPMMCDAAQSSCLAAAKDKPDEVKAQLEAHREDLVRYEALIAFKRYEEVLDYPLRMSTAFPQYGSVTGAHRAYVLRAATEAQRGNIDAALAAIERDIAFQRTMMTGSRTLLGKVVASVDYWRDLAFLSDLMQNRKAEVRPHLPRIREMLKSTEFPAAGMGVIVESEFGFRKALLNDPLAPAEVAGNPDIVEKLAVRFLYKPNATLNQEVKHLAAVAAAMDLPVNEGSAALGKIMVGDVQMSPWQYVDNPTGNLLRRVAITDSGKEAYQRLRLHDVRAYARLVALQAELASANVETERIGAFVAASDARFHDPYTEKPMAWDAASRRLSVEVQSKVTQQRKLLNLDKGRVYVQL